MARIDFTNLLAPFDGGRLIDFASTPERGPAYFDYLTTDGDFVYVDGTGFEFAPADGFPTGGRVQRVRIGLVDGRGALTPEGGGDVATADVNITGLDAALTDLVRDLLTGFPSGPESQAFWRVVLAGDDVVIVDADQDVTSFGADPESVDGLGRELGDDVIRGEVSSGSSIFGDAATAAPAERGGDDLFELSAAPGVGQRARLSGDFGFTANLEGIVGGADRFVLSGVGPFEVFGDVMSFSLGDVRGGNDVIDARGLVAAARLSGDFNGFGADGPFGPARGGRDRVLGGSGDDLIFGDAVDSPRGTIIGGADVLRGGDGDDRIFGETGNGGEVRGGADKLYGQDGNDRLWGDKGNDSLWGGAGADEVRGGAGRDRLHGGKGRDVLEGGAGRDVFVLGRRDGRDRIEDFEQRRDKIEITSGAGRFDALDIDGRGGDVRIAFARTVVIVEDAEVGDFSRSDFVFS